jgi:hypothetical protein
MSFDTFGWSFLNVFIIQTLEGWSAIMYSVQYTVNVSRIFSNSKAFRSHLLHIAYLSHQLRIYEPNSGYYKSQVQWSRTRQNVWLEAREYRRGCRVWFGRIQALRFVLQQKTRFRQVSQREHRLWHYRPIRAQLIAY